LTGYNVRDLDFYLAYAAIQWAIVFLRTGQRQAHFGEREIPADVEEMILSRPLLERLISH
jgi:aminoglycoside phosphotransferase (APT) family kinase protein